MRTERREKIARIIDPDEWSSLDRSLVTSRGRVRTATDALKERYCKRSLSKADEIISLVQGECARNQPSGDPRSALATGLEAEGSAERGEKIASQDRLSRDRDIILEAINEYDGWLADDDYDARGCLERIIERMRDRAFLAKAASAPSPTLASDAAGVGGLDTPAGGAMTATIRSNTP